MNAYLSWSGGKDATLALYRLLQQGTIKVEALLTNISRDYERISMHGVRKTVLLRQLSYLKKAIPLYTVELWEGMSMDDYSQLMKEQVEQFLTMGCPNAIFGDIFLEDLRKYREERLALAGIQAHFPLWGCSTLELVQEFIELEFKAIVVCTNAKVLDQSFVGRVIDHSFIADLPEGVDPCGENGEFHSFVFDGPLFREAVPFELGKTVHKVYEGEGVAWDTAFWYVDLL